MNHVSTLALAAGLLLLGGCEKQAENAVSTLAPPKPVDTNLLGHYYLEVGKDQALTANGRWCYLELSALADRPDRLHARAWRPDDQDVEVTRFAQSGNTLQLTLVRQFEIERETEYGLVTSEVTETWVVSGKVGVARIPASALPALSGEREEDQAGEDDEDSPTSKPDVPTQVRLRGKVQVERYDSEADESRIRYYSLVAWKQPDLDENTAYEELEQTLEAHAKKETDRRDKIEQEKREHDAAVRRKKDPFRG